ncbi:unnamed protein product [Mytilus edulis]|uniref:G-protein coupled receptors family 1 profile domain-containing protein n=1 Tax=Mytilus edulis TaxID=6550 RepID=A0A8S3RS92_MYTED|nr:unnamed protein product [Mytilus edulis]
MVNVGMLLEELNHEEAKQYVGGVIFVTIIMIIGIIGNLHVLFIYTFRMKPSNHRIFILSLAVLDMITCIVGMPFIIVDLRNPLTFTMVSACKVLRFVNYFICISSALILTVIAIDRYRKICVPLGKQISRRIAKVLILVCLGTSMVLSWPAPVLYGHSSINTTNPNITGVRCFTEDQFKNTKFQAYFNAVLILVVFGVFGILLVMYSLIGRVISKHTTFKSSVPCATSSDSSKSKITVSTDASSEDKPVFKGEYMTKNMKTANLKEKVMIDLPMASTDSSSSAGTKHTHVKPETKKHEKSKFDRAKRTTSVLKATISDTSKGKITVSTDLSSEHKASKTFEEENRIDKMKCPNSKVTTVTGTDSALILTVIAIDRYRKICVPLGKQISKRIAKVLILVCLGTSMVLSWPAPVLYGHSSINTTNPNITGVRCFTEDQFKNTQLQAYFNAILILLVFVVFGILLVLYSLIGMVISKHTTFKGSVPGATSSDSSKHKITVSTDASSEDKPVFKGENVTKNINGANLKENELIDLPQASLSVTGTNYTPALDFITCTVGMPFVVIDLRNPLTFTLIPACKILRFVNYFVCSSSAFILLVIAIDRYRKICFPLGKQISRNKAKYFCLVALATSMILSWPAPILYGHSSVNTTNPNITGVRCFTEDKFKNQRYQAYFNELLIIVFFGMFVILVVLYILMAKAIAQHEKFRKSFPVAGNFGKSKYKNIDIHSEPTQRRKMEPCDIMSNLESSKSWYAIKPVDSMGTSCMSISTISGNAHNGTYINGKEDSTETSLASLPKTNTTQINGQNKNHHRHHFIHFHILKRTTIMIYADFTFIGKTKGSKRLNEDDES